MEKQKDGLRADLAALETRELVEELRKREGVESIVILSQAFYAIYMDGAGQKKYGPAILLIVED